MVLDYKRHCHYSYMQLWRDGDHAPVYGRWMRAEKDAKILEEESYFRALFTWNRGEDNGPIGEQTDMAHPYYKGQNPLRYAGRSHCGSAEAITGGGRTGVDPPIRTNNDGSSACCSLVPFAVTSFANEAGQIRFKGTAGLVTGPAIPPPLPCTAFMVLYRLFGDPNDFPMPDGWTLFKRYQWTGTWAANLLLYRRDWPSVLDIPDTVVTFGTTIFTTGCVFYLDSPGCRLYTDDHGEYGDLPAGTYDLPMPRLLVPEGGALWAGLWLFPHNSILVSSTYPPYDYICQRFATTFEMGFNSALPAGRAPAYTQRRTTGEEYALRWWNGIFVR